tara:strand:- start:9 stop:389 length:381 start_codon:yes stop_codon:yes gene_type:complete
MILPTDSAKRKEYPIYTGFMAYFPRAIAEVAHQSYKGNEKHNHGEPLHWAKEKSNDHMDCIARHMLDQMDGQLDPIAEKVATAWRAMAELEIALERVDGNEHHHKNMAMAWVFTKERATPLTNKAQ